MHRQNCPPKDTSARFETFMKLSLALGPMYLNVRRFIAEIVKNSTLLQLDISKYSSFGVAGATMAPTRVCEHLMHTTSKKGQLNKRTQVVVESRLCSST